MVTELFITKQNGETFRLPCVELTLFHKKNAAAGSLTATLLKDTFDFPLGSLLTLKVDSVSFFQGFLFSLIRENDKVILLAFDQIRYLLAKDYRVLNNVTASDFILQLAHEKGLSVGEIKATPHVFDGAVFRDTSYLNMIATTLAETFSATNMDYVFFDKGGDLFLKRCDDLVLSTALSDKSNILSYFSQTEVFSDTSNYIKVLRESKKMAVTHTFVKEDPVSQGNWGTLQHLKRVNEKTTDGQIQQWMDTCLLQKNRATNTFLIDAIGDKSFFVGHIVFVEISSLSVSEFFILEEVTHHWKNNNHFCKLKIRQITNNREE